MDEQQWVGIDVCQKNLDVYVRPSSKILQLENNETGIAQLVQELIKIEPELIVLEATGGMEINVSRSQNRRSLSMKIGSKNFSY